jgi:hypothetical protein
MIAHCIAREVFSSTDSQACQMFDFQLPPETNSKQDTNILIVKKGLAVVVSRKS